MLETAFTGLSLTPSSSVFWRRPCQLHSASKPAPLQRSTGCPLIEAAHKKGGGSTKNGRYVGFCSPQGRILRVLWHTCAWWHCRVPEWFSICVWGQPLQQDSVAAADISLPFQRGVAHTIMCCAPCRDSNPQMRGVKVYGGQPVKAGGIIMRQLGTKVGAAACRASMLLSHLLMLSGSLRFFFSLRSTILAWVWAWARTSRCMLWTLASSCSRRQSTSGG